VYAWGAGGSGQLGLGKRSSFPSPQLVWGLMRKGVRQIAAGEAHSLALTYNGQVYSWGSSKLGQLGHKDRKSRYLPRMIQYLDDESRERSSTVRLIGAGAKHSVAVMHNGDLYLWGRPDFGKLGRARMDAYNEPVRIDALWRREVAEGHTDRTKALGKEEITELLNQNLDVHDIERYFPDIQSDPEAALYLAKAVADDLQKRVTRLEAELHQAREDQKTQLDKYIAKQEEAFALKEKQGLEKLLEDRQRLEKAVETHQNSVHFQTTVEENVQKELAELNAQIGKDEMDRTELLEQAHTSEKADLDKSLRQALDALRQAKKDKEIALVTAQKQVRHATEELEAAQGALSTARVEIQKHQKLGYVKSIDQTTLLIKQVSSLSQRLAETAIEHIDPSKQAKIDNPRSLRDLLAMSDEEIDGIMSDAAAFCSDEYVDVSVRQDLATLLFDNAEMRKQINAYVGGILTQTMETLDQNRNPFSMVGGGGGGGADKGWFGNGDLLGSLVAVKQARAPTGGIIGAPATDYEQSI